jgi:hypothetical protein
METSYRDIFVKKMKSCKSKKDYKKLCKEMIFQYGVIDKIDANQWKLLSEIMGEDTYAQVVALSIKMYLLEQQGVGCDILSITDYDA